MEDKLWYGEAKAAQASLLALQVRDDVHVQAMLDLVRAELDKLSKE
jgi:hypothetical protein